jgi:hypothetical protein
LAYYAIGLSGWKTESEFVTSSSGVICERAYGFMEQVPPRFPGTASAQELEVAQAPAPRAALIIRLSSSCNVHRARWVVFVQQEDIDHAGLAH